MRKINIGKNLGDFIFEKFKEGLTNTEIAKEVGISQSTLCRYLMDRRNEVSNLHRDEDPSMKLVRYDSISKNEGVYLYSSNKGYVVKLSKGFTCLEFKAFAEAELMFLKLKKEGTNNA